VFAVAAVLAILKRTDWFCFATVLRDVRKKRVGPIRNGVGSCDLPLPISPVIGVWLKLENADDRRSALRPGDQVSVGSSVQSTFNTSQSMAGLEEVVTKLLEDPATEQIASEIGGASAHSHFCSMKNHPGKFYSPSTAMMLWVFGKPLRNPRIRRLDIS